MHKNQLHVGSMCVNICNVTKDIYFAKNRTPRIEKPVPIEEILHIYFFIFSNLVNCLKKSAIYAINLHSLLALYTSDSVNFLACIQCKNSAQVELNLFKIENLMVEQTFRTYAQPYCSHGITIKYKWKGTHLANIRIDGYIVILLYV